MTISFSIGDEHFIMKKSARGGPFIDINDHLSHRLAKVKMENKTLKIVEGALDMKYFETLTFLIYNYYGKEGKRE